MCSENINQTPPQSSEKTNSNLFIFSFNLANTNVQTSGVYPEYFLSVCLCGSIYFIRTMPDIACPIDGCDYTTGDVSADVVAALLTIHNNVHVNGARTTPKQKAPKIQRPTISRGSTEESWNSFTARWTIFKRGTSLDAAEVCQQLFSCCDEELGNDILRQNNDILNSTEQNFV